MFVVGRGGGGIYSPETGSQSLRRVSSIRRTCSAAVKRKSLGLQVKHTTVSIPQKYYCTLKALYPVSPLVDSILYLVLKNAHKIGSS